MNLAESMKKEATEFFNAHGIALEESQDLKRWLYLVEEAKRLQKTS